MTVIKQESIFTGKYIPSEIVHRDNEIKEISNRMNRPLSGSPAKNTLIQGMGGTGKTLIVRYVAEQLSKQTTDVQVYYFRLRDYPTEYKAIKKISQELTGVDYQGHSSQYIYERVFEHIKHKKNKYTVFIFDEVDAIEKGYAIFLDMFLRYYENFNMWDKEVSVIYISNNTKFPQDLPVGTKSSWSCIDKLTFERYKADQLRDILVERAEKGLYEGTYNESVIPLCAAMSAQEHGDARRSIELLGKAAQMAQSEGAKIIKESHVRKAWDQLEYDRPVQQINALPIQGKAITLAIIWDFKKGLREKYKDGTQPTTASVYAEYKEICKHLDILILTQRRVRDILLELSAMELINTYIEYKGRYGNSLHVALSIPHEVVEKVLASDPVFSSYLKPL